MIEHRITPSEPIDFIPLNAVQTLVRIQGILLFWVEIKQLVDRVHELLSLLGRLSSRLLLILL